MGMFQPQNYGADFVNSMAATSGMLNDRRKLDMAEKKETEETQIRAQEAKTRDLQHQGLQIDNQKKAQDVARETALADFLDRRKRMEAGTLTPDDYPALAGDTQKVMEFTPYLPSDPAEIPKYKQSLSTLIQGVDSIRSLPASNYHYTRADNIPEVNATLDAYQTMLSKDRLGKEFVDADGSVTGKAGNTYRTTGVGGFVMASGNGKEAAFTPLFSIADAQGNPVIGADGKPVMVPATVNGSNSPNDQIRQVTPEEMLTKAGFAYKVLDTADKLGLSDPAKQKEYFAQNLPYYMGEKGAEAIMKRGEKETGVFERDPTKELWKKDGTLLADAKPKEDKDKAPTTRTVKRDGFEVSEEYVGDGKWKVVARNKIKEGKSDDSGPAKGGKRTIKEIVDEYQALKKARDAQFAKDEKNWRQENARRTKDMQPLISFEKYYGGKSSQAHAAITQDMYQLRDVAAGLDYDLINMKPLTASAPPPSKAQAKPQQAAPPKKQQVASAKPKTAADYLKAKGM